MNSGNFKEITLIILLVSAVQSTMLITSPAINPFDQSKIPYSYANIGNIPYGKTLTFDLKQLPDTDLCQNMQTINHITDPTYLIINSSVGTCSYTTQAINAQKLGAKGVVFVSDIINYYGKVVQVDDGNGRKVHISVLFISTQTYRSLHSIKNVHIKVQFQVYKTDKVNLTYFLSASGRTNYIFLREFQPYYQKIKELVNFKPIYITFKCPFCTEQDCLISKDYCMFELDNYKDNMGEAILKQQINQWNLWKTYGTQTYLNYMNNFDKFCTVNWLESENCSNDILKDLAIAKVNIDQSPSSIMDQWKMQQVAAGFLTTPQLTINEELYAGTYDPVDIYEAVCSSFINTPAACLPTQTSQGSSKLGWIIGVIVIACIISMLLGFYFYRKCVKKQLTKDMFSKVNELVARYATKVSDHNKKRKDRIKMQLTEEL